MLLQTNKTMIFLILHSFSHINSFPWFSPSHAAYCQVYQILRLPLKLDLLTIPINFCILLKSLNFSGFVKMSAIWSNDITNFNSISLWNLVSICLLRSWKTGFFTKARVDLLSVIITVGSICSSWSSIIYLVLAISKDMQQNHKSVVSLNSMRQHYFLVKTQIRLYSFDHLCLQQNHYHNIP